ncbi:MAG: PP2C family protein-serine/threonine phosphatase [Bryobacteraceae bacterium]
MAIEAYGRTDPGCVRTENEDRISIDTSLGLFVVCDGMGGHQHGEVAAELAVAAIRYYVDASRDRFDVSWPFGYSFEISVDANRLVTGVRLANKQVWRRAEQALEYSGMGTTVAAVLLSEDRGVIANVGDSRVYLFRDPDLVQISVDDTMVGSMLQKGLLSPADVANHPMKNVLTQAAGSKEQVDVHVREEPLLVGDKLLLCTDGLYGVIDEAAIRSMLASDNNVVATVEDLVFAARKRGAPDNVSAVLLSRCE